MERNSHVTGSCSSAFSWLSCSNSMTWTGHDFQSLATRLGRQRWEALPMLCADTAVAGGMSTGLGLYQLGETWAEAESTHLCLQRPGQAKAEDSLCCNTLVLPNSPACQLNTRIVVDIRKQRTTENNLKKLHGHLGILYALPLVLVKL